MSVRPSRRLANGLASVFGAARRYIANESPPVLASGSAEGMSRRTGSSAPAGRVPDATVRRASALITARRLEGGGSVSSDDQVIPAGTRVEYKARMLRTGVETGWVLADNDSLRQLPRLAAVIGARCEVSYWPQDGGGAPLVALALWQTEEGVGAPCDSIMP